MRNLGRSYDRWLTTPPEQPEPLDWDRDMLEHSPAPVFKRRKRTSGDRVYFTYVCVGHQCTDCARFLPTTPHDVSVSSDGTAFEFRCACGSRLQIEVEHECYRGPDPDERDDYFDAREYDGPDY